MEIRRKTDKKAETERCVESLLYDVLKVVFSHMTPEQVRIAATVSKSWQYEAYKNLSKRKIPINSVVLPNPQCDCSIIPHLQRECDVYDRYTKKIGFTPRFAIFFIDPQIETARVYSHYGPWILTSRPPVPESQYGVIIESWRIYDDEKNLSDTSDNGVADSIAAFAIPELNNLIKIDRFVPRMDESGEEFVDRILPTDVEKPCFIAFDTLFKAEQTEFIKTALKERYQLGRFTLWGGCVPKITLVSRRCEEFPEPYCVWLRITGKLFRTWSVVLTQDMSEIKIKGKLIKLKTKMELLAETVAFALVPTISGEENQTIARVLLFKTIFPNIRLKTVLTNHDYHFYRYSFGVSSTETVMRPLLAYKYGISILVITSM